MLNDVFDPVQPILDAPMSPNACGETFSLIRMDAADIIVIRTGLASVSINTMLDMNEPMHAVPLIYDGGGGLKDRRRALFMTPS